MNNEGRRVLLAKAIAEVVPDRYPDLRADVRRYVLPLLATFEQEVRGDVLPSPAHGLKCAGPRWRQGRSRYECACGNAWTAQPLAPEDAVRTSGPHASPEFDEADMSADEGRP